MDVLLFKIPTGTNVPSVSPIRLTGDRPEEGVSGGQRTHSRVQEMVDLVEADEAQGFDLGNAKSVEQFSITRWHANEGLASLYYDTHPTAVSGRADVEFLHKNSLGSIVARTRHTGCNILCTGGEWDGCVTTMQYTITWGG